ncbi:hypothetical protein QR680_016188 [Steinernema hermaphroditum]|uniref:G-protein coupled receptors family 1 profile domain-containing protein n=1 Tax=Steinernema hermaphroditum TaxID=289476 RepID=A0AA39HCW3_9BILA|nr:hypothetical protein QR680_016188 [Steinernema hermaphroditum]
MWAEDTVREYKNYYLVPRIFITVSTVISLPLNILCMYLIVFYSPTHLRFYKYVLLNISVWVFATDVVAIIIFLPMPLAEIFAAYPTGLAEPLGPIAGFVLVVIMVFLFGEYLMALLIAFLYRYHSLKSDVVYIFGKKMSKIHYYIGMILLTAVPPGSMGVAMSLTYSPHEELRKFTLSVSTTTL